MRYLSWDEVKGLEKFLAEDNDDAVGIEIHTGLYDLSADDRYGKPETVKAYSLEELAVRFLPTNWRHGCRRCPEHAGL